MVGANLGGGRRQGFGHGGGWRARGGEWVGPGGRWEGERANGGQRGPRGGLLWRGDGAPWTSAPARSLPLLGFTGAHVCVSRAFVEMVYGWGREGRSGKVAERRTSGLAHWGSRAALARVLLEVRERERGGGQHGGVMRTLRHLDWREGEARGGGGARRQRLGAC